MKSIRWLHKETVLAIHNAQIKEHGGLYGIREMSLLESALDRPKNLHAYSENGVSIVQLAASYAFGLSSNHPFIDGNKRVALVASYTFCRLNGFEVIASEADSVTFFLKLATNQISEEDFTTFLTRNTRALTGNKVSL
jgi:death-on-curing protein